MDIAFYTCPRTPAYISTTLDSFFQQWDEKPYVFATTGTPNFINQARVNRIDTPEGLNCISHWLYCIEKLANKIVGDKVMFCEDDICFLDGAKDKIEICLSNLEATGLKFGFVSPYCSVINKPKGKGWQKPAISDSLGFCGTLCAILHRDTVELIARKKDVFLEIAENRHVDYGLGQFCRNHGLDILVHRPTLVLHTGAVSTCAGVNNVWKVTDESRTPCLS